MRKLIFTKDELWQKKWDKFVYDNPKGSHLIYSDWLKAYKSYGFEFELGLVLKSGEIVGGYGAVIAKFLFFKFYIIPHGPIYMEDHMNCFKSHLHEIINHAKQIGCCYLQLSLPISQNHKIEMHSFDAKIVLSLNELKFKTGKLFKYIYSSYGLNWIDLKGYENAEDYLRNLTPKVRRNIRMPYNKLATARFATKMVDIENGYKIIVQNASQAGYSVRSFKEFKTSIYEMIKKKQAYFIICEVDAQIKAAAYLVNNSGYFTNVMGGVSREKPDIKLGYMLQWEIIKKSFEMNYSGYNISMGGSKGVQDFKSKFGAESIHYNKPNFYAVLKPFYFKFFKIFDSKLKRYKYRVSKFLSSIK